MSKLKGIRGKNVSKKDAQKPKLLYLSIIELLRRKNLDKQIFETWIGTSIFINSYILQGKGKGLSRSETKKRDYLEKTFNN